MQRICFYRFPLAMREFLFKVTSLRQGGENPIETLWIDPELGKEKIEDLLARPLLKEKSWQEYSEHEIDSRNRAVIYLAGFTRAEISPIVQLFRKAVAGNFDLIFSAQTETNVQWSFNRLWHDVVEDHDYFKELELAHKEGRPFTLIPDDDKPTSL